MAFLEKKGGTGAGIRFYFSLQFAISHRPLNGPQHGGVPENSPLTLMGRFPSLMGRFPILMGRFPECLDGPFSLSKILWKTALA